MVELQEYNVQIPPEIFTQLQNIKDYVANVLFSPQTAEKQVRHILADLRNLKTFPERGFDADAKVGKQISKFGKTYGIVVGNKKYLAFYTIDKMDGKKFVFVTYLVPARSDYAKLFL